MQTFLPIADFTTSAKILDKKRLWKQVVEAGQLIDVILDRPTKSGNPRIGWKNHPATKMWKNNVEALKLYHNIFLIESLYRGINTSRDLEDMCESNPNKPLWFGDERFHASHRSNLLRKDFTYYSQFGWIEPDNLPYIWPE